MNRNLWLKMCMLFAVAMVLIQLPQVVFAGDCVDGSFFLNIPGCKAQADVDT